MLRVDDDGLVFAISNHPELFFQGQQQFSANTGLVLVETRITDADDDPLHHRRLRPAVSMYRQAAPKRAYGLRLVLALPNVGVAGRVAGLRRFPISTCPT